MLNFYAKIQKAKAEQHGHFTDCSENYIWLVLCKRDYQTTACSWVGSHNKFVVLVSLVTGV